MNARTHAGSSQKLLEATRNIPTIKMSPFDMRCKSCMNMALISSSKWPFSPFKQCLNSKRRPLCRWGPKRWIKRQTGKNRLNRIELNVFKWTKWSFNSYLVNRRIIITTAVNTELISIISIWSVMGFRFLPKRLFGRILTFYMHSIIFGSYINNIFVLVTNAKSFRLFSFA